MRRNVGAMRKFMVLLLFLGFYSLSATVGGAEMKSFHELSVQDIDGNSVALAAYEGKVKLVVNTASQCGYTPQFAGLQNLYEKYEAKGLVVLGFPSNDFGGQDPGSNEEIKNYCTAKYDVSFPMFSKSHVTGAEKNELYALLTSEAPEKGEVGWNFEKFLVSRDGQVLSRFRTRVEPESDELVAAIEEALQQ